MLQRIITLGSLLLVTVLLWFSNTIFYNPSLLKLFYTAVVFSVAYAFFRFVMEGILSRRIKDDKAKYTFRKTVTILFWVVSGVLTLRVWIVNPQALLVAYGLLGAGVAVALQDFFKNFVGGITIFLNGMYRTGDRIEVNGEFGDIIDVGVMYTTVLEMKEWVGGDQATGRICTIPNGFVLSHVVNNYTRDHNFIWDEIKLPITYDSDWKFAMKKILHVVKTETHELEQRAEKEISRMKEKFYVAKRDVQPNIFVTMTDNWIEFNIRYVVDVKSRRLVRNKLTQLILEEIQKSKKIKIASQTLDIIGFPGKRKR